MRNSMYAAAAAVALLAAAPAAHAQGAASPEFKKLMGLMAVGVASQMCGADMSPAVHDRVEQAASALAAEQKGFTMDQVNAGLDGMATNMAKNQASVCAGVQKEGIDAVATAKLEE